MDGHAYYRGIGVPSPLQDHRNFSHPAMRPPSLAGPCSPLTPNLFNRMNFLTVAPSQTASTQHLVPMEPPSQPMSVSFCGYVSPDTQPFTVGVPQVHITPPRTVRFTQSRNTKSATRSVASNTTPHLQEVNSLVRMAASYSDVAGSSKKDSSVSTESQTEHKYSLKVFLGGLPPDIDSLDIEDQLRRFGGLLVDWPRKAEQGCHFPPKGYAFAVFEKEISVIKLTNASKNFEGKLMIAMSSSSVKDKLVQVRPWLLSDAEYYFGSQEVLPDHRKMVFVGGVPRPMTAYELGDQLNATYGSVCFASIDVDDDLQYPKGSGGVAFTSRQSYLSAVRDRFITLKGPDGEKKAELKPFVKQHQPCDRCKSSEYRAYFCPNNMCLKYFCNGCWMEHHSAASNMQYHKPYYKESAERPRQRYASSSNSDHR